MIIVAVVGEGMWFAAMSWIPTRQYILFCSIVIISNCIIENLGCKQQMRNSDSNRCSDSRMAYNKFATLAMAVSSILVILSASSSCEHQRSERFSFSSIIPSFLNPCKKEERPAFSLESLIPGFDGLTEKEDRCKDPLKYAVSGAVKAVISRLMGPLLIPEVLKNAQMEMAGLIVEQSIEIGLKERNIAKAVSVPIGAQLKKVPLVGEKIENYVEPLMEKTIIGFLGTLCEQVNCCFD